MLLRPQTNTKEQSGSLKPSRLFRVTRDNTGNLPGSASRIPSLMANHFEGTSLVEKIRHALLQANSSAVAGNKSTKHPSRGGGPRCRKEIQNHVQQTSQTGPADQRGSRS